VSVLATIERSLHRVGHPVTLGSSVGSFMKAMLEN